MIARLGHRRHPVGGRAIALRSAQMSRRSPASNLFELVASSLTRFGALPALWVVATAYVAAVSAALLFPEGGTREYDVVSAVGVAVIVYCFARPCGGVEVWGTCAAPAAIGSILQGLAGAPSWVTFLAMPLALLIARDIDRTDEARPTDPQPGADHLPPLRP